MSAPLANTHVVLVRPQGPINVGLACRAAANMGARSVRVVAPGPDALDINHTRPFACHATDLVEAIVPYPNLPAALADVDFALGTSRRIRRGWQTFLEPPAAGETIARCPVAAAVVFGSEADGLTTEELQACDATLAVDLPGDYKSLNLSHAVAVVLWSLHSALSAQADAPTPRPEALASGGQRRALLRLWEAALEETGYFRRLYRGRFASKLHALVNNVALTGRDVQLMAGMLRHWRSLPCPPEEGGAGKAVSSVTTEEASIGNLDA